MAGVRWADVDFQWNSITIHDQIEACILEQAGIEFEARASGFARGELSPLELILV